LFVDFYRYAVRPVKSLSVLYDHRDVMADITRQVVTQSDLLRDLTDLQTSNLTQRSRKLFTLSSFHTANGALLRGIEPDSVERRVELAGEFWRIVAEQFPVWQQVSRGEATAGQVRTDFIHTSSLVLHALGEVGNTLMRQTSNRSIWRRRLAGLRDIDWHRHASVWDGKATVGGQISKGRANVEATRDQILRTLGMNARDTSEPALDEAVHA